MLKSEKALFVSEMRSVFLDNDAIFFIHYHGLSAAQMNDLRVKLRSVSARLKVAKNTLSKIAACEEGIDLSDELNTGPVAIAYSSDPVSLAKALFSFAEDNSSMQINGSIVSNVKYDYDQSKYFTELLSIDEYRAKIAMLISSVSTKLVRTINSPASSIVSVIESYFANRE